VPQILKDALPAHVEEENLLVWVRLENAIKWGYLLCSLTGGPGQLPHLAPTYAAICALCIVGTEQAFESVDRFV